MSRVGKQPVPIPQGVEVTVSSPDVHVKGPKGELDLSYRDDHVDVRIAEGEVVVERKGTAELVCRAAVVPRVIGHDTETGLARQRQRVELGRVRQPVPRLGEAAQGHEAVHRVPLVCRGLFRLE